MIHIVCGNPGAGKTSLLTMLCCQYMTFNAFDDCWRSNQFTAKLNAVGYNLSYVTDHCCASNYPIISNYKYCIQNISYDFDGVDFGLPDSEHTTKFIPYGFRLFLHEAQGFLNSRNSAKFRDSVSRAYEQHRHWGLDIWLDCQRETLIDLNIREITPEILECQKFTAYTDKDGEIIKCVWIVHKFNSNSAYESYISGTKAKGDYETVKYVYDGNIFECYDSEGSYPLFLEGRKNKDYDLEHHFIDDGSSTYINRYIKHHSLNNIGTSNYYKGGK